MSWLSKATGINIDLLGALKKNPAEVGGTIAGAVTGQLPIATAVGTLIAEIDPSALTNIESAVNNLLISKGLAATVAEADALIEAEFAKLGIGGAQ